MGNIPSWVLTHADGFGVRELAVELLGPNPSEEEVLELAKFCIHSDVECQMEYVDGEDILTIYISNRTVAVLNDRYPNAYEVFKRALRAFKTARHSEVIERRALVSLGAAPKSGAALKKALKGAKTIKNMPGSGHKSMKAETTHNSVSKNQSAGGTAQAKKGKTIMSNNNNTPNNTNNNNNNNNPNNNNPNYNYNPSPLEMEMLGTLKNINTNINNVNNNINKLSTSVSNNTSRLDALEHAVPFDLLAAAKADPQAFVSNMAKQLLGLDPAEFKKVMQKISQSPDSKKVKEILRSEMSAALKEMHENGKESKDALAKQLHEEFGVPTWKRVLNWVTIGVSLLTGGVILLETIQGFRGKNGLLIKREFSQADVEQLAAAHGGFAQFPSADA